MRQQVSREPPQRLTSRLIVTDDKEGENSVFQREIHDVGCEWLRD